MAKFIEEFYYGNFIQDSMQGYELFFGNISPYEIANFDNCDYTAPCP